MPPRGPDYRQHRQRINGGSRYKNPLRIGPQVWRINQKTFGHGEAKVIRHHAFDDFVIFEFQPHPQTFRPRTAGEGLSGSGIGVAELPDEIDSLDVLQINGDYIPRCIQQLQLAFPDERSWGDISVE